MSTSAQDSKAIIKYEYILPLRPESTSAIAEWPTMMWPFHEARKHTALLFWHYYLKEMILF